jgi:Short C-terminal domain
MNGRTIPHILTRVAIITMVISAVGLIATQALNWLVFDKYDVYDQVQMKDAKSSMHHLPAGDVKVYVHALPAGGVGGSLVPPGLQVRIHLPTGEKPMRDDRSSPTTVDGDAWVQVGHLDVPAEDNYRIEADGNMSGYEKAMLAFGQPNAYRILPLAFGIAFGLAVVLFLIARLWEARLGPAPVSGPRVPSEMNGGAAPPRPSGDRVSPPRAAPTVPTVSPQQAAPTVPTVSPQQAAPTVPNVPTQQAAPTVPIVPAQQAESATPSDEREDTLNTLAELRDSGVLTDEEYDAEKKRVLEGG